MSKRAKQLFIIFSYLTLILVVAAFAAIVASTFGATYENGVLNEAKSATQASVAMVSLLFILVDGEFMLDKKDVTLLFKGSSNQRTIDVPKSLAAGKIIAWDPRDTSMSPNSKI